jgi:hypothetical protein
LAFPSSRWLDVLSVSATWGGSPMLVLAGTASGNWLRLVQGSLRGKSAWLETFQPHFFAPGTIYISAVMVEGE